MQRIVKRYQNGQQTPNDDLLTLRERTQALGNNRRHEENPRERPQKPEVKIGLAIEHSRTNFTGDACPVSISEANENPTFVRIMVQNENATVQNRAIAMILNPRLQAYAESTFFTQRPIAR